MVQLDQNNFKKEVIDYTGVVLVDFYADWCGPCRILSPLIDELDRENKNPDIKFAKLNVDENQQLAGLYGVMSIPTVIIFKKGKLITQKIGVEDKDSYKSAIKKAFDFDPNAKVKHDIKIFTTPTCPYCHMAKDYLKENKISFKEYDVSKDQKMAIDMYQKSGQLGVPQLWIDDQVVMGFNKPQIDMLLGL